MFNRLKIIDYLRFRKISHVECYDHHDCKILFVFYTNGLIEKYGKVYDWCQLKPKIKNVSNFTQRRLNAFHDSAKLNNDMFIIDYSYYGSLFRKKIPNEWKQVNHIVIICEESNND